MTSASLKSSSMPGRGLYLALLEALEKTALPDDWNMGSAFAAKHLLLNQELMRSEPDVDQIKNLSRVSFEFLLRSLRNQGVVTFYTPPIYTDPLSEARKVLTEKANKEAQAILSTLSIPIEARVDGAHQLLYHTNNYIQVLLKINGYSGIEELILTHLEMQKFWDPLKAQRQSLIRNNTALYYQLRSTSIFPLKYEIQPGSGGNALKHLFNIMGLSYPPTTSDTLKHYSEKLHERVTELANQQADLDQLKFQVADITRVHVDDFSLLDPYSLIPVILGAATIHSYHTSWLQANPRKKYIHRMLLAAADKQRGRIFASSGYFTPPKRVTQIRCETEAPRTKRIKHKTLKKTDTRKQLCFQLPGKEMPTATEDETGIEPLDRADDVLSSIVQTLFMSSDSEGDSSAAATAAGAEHEEQSSIYLPECSPITPF